MPAPTNRAASLAGAIPPAFKPLPRFGKICYGQCDSKGEIRAMRAIHCVLLGCAAIGGSATGQVAGNSAKTTPAPIHFDLAAPKEPAAESLPVATTLDQLTYANEAKPVAKPAPKPMAKAPPRPAPRPARKAVAAKELPAAWMSPWRRAYIAKHGHQPPVPVR